MERCSSIPAARQRSRSLSKALAVSATIRAREALNGRPRVPIVALTANAFESDRERCLAAGMDEHLSKPFRNEELESVLSRYLRPVEPGAA